jgi:hypothetical protein
MAFCERGCHCETDRHIEQEKNFRYENSVEKEQSSIGEDALNYKLKISGHVDGRMPKVEEDRIKMLRKVWADARVKQEVVVDAKPNTMEKGDISRIIRSRPIDAAQQVNREGKASAQNRGTTKEDVFVTNRVNTASTDDDFIFELRKNGQDDGGYIADSLQEIATLEEVDTLHRIFHQDQNLECEGTCLCDCGTTQFACENKAGCKKAVDKWGKEDCKLRCVCSCGTVGQMICRGESDCKSAVQKCWEWGCDEDLKHDL